MNQSINYQSLLYQLTIEQGIIYYYIYTLYIIYRYIHTLIILMIFHCIIEKQCNMI